MQHIEPKTTALVLIDLQKGIIARELFPYAGPQVVQVAQSLANSCRSAGILVVLVNVSFAADFKDALRQEVDQPFKPPVGGFPPGYSDLADGLAGPGDIRITKHQWGAFYGTALDLQLRRRGIQTIILGGIATNIGVESTARQAWEHGYNLIMVEDATTGTSTEMHKFAFTHIFPRLSRVTTSSDLHFS